MRRPSDASDQRQTRQHESLVGFVRLCPTTGTVSPGIDNWIYSFRKSQIMKTVLARC